MSNYLAFLLRIWRDGNSDHSVWRASLEDPHTRQMVYFTNLTSLIEYITQMQEQAGNLHLQTLTETKEK